MRFLIEMLSTGFFTGYIPFMPGTFGSLIGLFLYFLFFSNLSPQFYLILLFVFFIFSIYICDFAEKNIFKIKDSPHIVLDEILGVLIALFPLTPLRNGKIFQTFIAFFIFRLFDILKPFPIKTLQETKGGVGIVIDDVLAGIYTAIFMYICSIYFQAF